MANHEGVIGFLELQRRSALRAAEMHAADPRDAAASRGWAHELARAIDTMKADAR